MKQDRALAREIVRRWGWNVTSYQILNPGFTYWVDEPRDAVVGYIESHETRVVAGAPVCADDQFDAVVRAFEVDAAAQNCGVVYFAAEDRVAELALRGPRRLTFPIGAQPFWRPSDLLQEFSRHASLRAQLNRARNKGVSVQLATGIDSATSAHLGRCLQEWKDTRGLPPLHFLIETDTLSTRQDRQLLIATRAGAPVGFLIATPIPARNGWLIEQIVRGKEGPNGMAELLVFTAAELLHAEGAALMTLGLAPLARRAPAAIDESPVWLKGLLMWLQAHGRRFYNFAGLETFKAKFGQAHWSPVYASLSPGTHLSRALLAITAAFSGEPVHRFVPHVLARSLMQEVHSKLR